jgi:type IV secretion system protein VirB9
VWDDGRKTYIKMSGSMAVNDAPVLFIRNANGLVMVNYRLQNGCFVVDRLFNKAELRNGKEVIKIRRSKSGG